MATNNSINRRMPNGFSAYLSSDITNATGDGTELPFICDSIIKTDGNYNNTTGVFTALETGIYCIVAAVKIANISTHSTFKLFAAGAGANTRNFYIVNPTDLGISGSLMLPGTLLLKLEKDEPVSVRMFVDGATKTITIKGGTAPYVSYLNCFLASYL